MGNVAESALASQMRICWVSIPGLGRSISNWALVMFTCNARCAAFGENGVVVLSMMTQGTPAQPEQRQLRQLPQDMGLRIPQPVGLRLIREYV